MTHAVLSKSLETLLLASEHRALKTRHEHDSATEFLEWLGDGAPTREPAVFFGKLWGHEEDGLESDP